METLVDVEGFVDVRVVDESFPSNCCARFLEVGAHDNTQIAGEFVGERFEAVRVFDGSFGVVDGAWSDDDEEAVIALFDDFDGLVSA